MGQIVDIRRYNNDNIINDLVDASKIRKNWFGKVTDKYWDYLEQAAENIYTDLNPYVIADFFVYLIEHLNFKEELNSYSNTLSENRNSFVTLLFKDDIEVIKSKINNSDFISNFENFCKELNGEYYDYNLDMLDKNIEKLKSAFNEIGENNALLINVC